jgi:hypothetical protein
MLRYCPLGLLLSSLTTLTSSRSAANFVAIYCDDLAYADWPSADMPPNLD